MRKTFILTLFVQMVVFSSIYQLGCGDDENQQAMPILEPPAEGTGIQLAMMSTLEPGQEVERCKFFRVPDEGLLVKREQTRFSSGSHHVLLFSTPYREIPTVNRQGDTVDTRDIFDCEEGAFGEWDVDGAFAGSQSPHAEVPVIDLPDGVVFKIEGGTLLLMNTHYINATPEKSNNEARINLYTTTETPTQYAGVFFFYNPIIHVPPRGQSSARMRCPIDKDITLLNAQSHMHARGTGYQAYTSDAAGKLGELLYENDRWETVPVATWPGNKVLKAQSWVDYRCDYRNTEDRAVIQGLTTRDEMCMFIGAYYPRDRALELCSTSDQFSGVSSAATYVGAGNATCDQTFECIGKAGLSRAEQYACVVASCPKIAPQMTSAIRCALANPLNYATACATEISACRATSC